jgi:YSIRK-targeted surface antigen transcriptional regulator
MNNYFETIKDKCNLVAETFDLPVFFINPTGDVIYENLINQSLNPLYENQTEKFFNPLNFRPSKANPFPVIKKSVFSEKYILVSIFNYEVYEGTVVTGPLLSFPLSEDRVSGIINDSRAFFSREKVSHFYKSLPIIKTKKIINISAFIYHLFNHQFLTPSLVIQENSKLTEENINNEKVDVTVSQNLQSHTFHHDRLFEKKILTIIREGRVDEIKELSSIKEEEVASILSKSSYLRSIKNHIITLITLVSRASIDGGLHEEMAFSLHDRFIQKVEELNRLDEVKSLAKEVLYTYAEKVKQIKEEQYSKTITACKDYIYKHIYEEINHNDIANYVDLSPKYLSALFKKEVGITVSEYIQQGKIEEVKKLLAYSKTPISEICSLLNYNDQSYFTKVFKKVVGITPKQYREKYHLLEKK